MGCACPPRAEHVPEPYGLFTIVLPGGCIAEVIGGIGSREHWPLPAASTAFGGMAFVFFPR